MPDKAKVLEKISQVLDNQWLSNMGPLSLELEERIAHMLGVKHCICVCNATIGLELLQRALDLKGEVIIPSFTFVATAHSLRWQRIDPVFCDVRNEDHLIDPDKIEALITPRTTAIMAVPIWGQPCDYEALQKIVDKHNLKLIFDSAHAFGCKYHNQYLGGFGDAEVFSFHATKIFSTGEGGAVTTNNDQLAEKLRLMRNFGFSGKDQVSSIGTNAKLCEFNAAYGLVSLENIQDIIAHNKNLYSEYLESFSDIVEIDILKYNPTNSNNHHYLVASVKPSLRSKILNTGKEHSFFLKRYFYPGVHRHAPYKFDKKYKNLHLEKTDSLCNRTICFPTGYQMNSERISNLKTIIKSSL